MLTSAINTARRTSELVLYQKVYHLAYLLLLTSSVASLPLGVAPESIPGNLESVRTPNVLTSGSPLPLGTHQFFPWRPKRELRVTSRKMNTSPVPMPAYFPFIMAEMLPVSIRTRHPSIIAISGCPAYYIADSNGRCRQAYQYNYQNQPQKPRGLYTAPTDILWTPRLHGYSSHLPSRAGPAPQKSNRLATLLRNAARRFDYALWQKQDSNNSGESTDSSDIDKLREQILSALKIKKSDNYDNNNQNSDDDD